MRLILENYVRIIYDVSGKNRKRIIKLKDEMVLTSAGEDENLICRFLKR